MKISTLFDALIQHEGLMLRLYKDTVGKYTIGCGRNIEDMGISKDEALYLLKNDIDRCKNELQKIQWYLPLDSVRREAIIELVFNMGLPSVLGFKKMISFIEAKDFDKAASELLNSKWATQVGKERSSNIASRLKNGKY